MEHFFDDMVRENEKKPLKEKNSLLFPYVANICPTQSC
jgi:hypothetical protein